MSFYAFRTEPQKEFAAQEIVNRHGYRAIVPYEWRTVRRSRHVKRRDHRIYPAMVGYLFVEITHPPNWYEMFSMRCLKSVVGTSGMPTPIPASAIDRLLAMRGESMPHLLSRNTRRASIIPGDHVQVWSGPFTGLEGKVEEIKGQHAALWLEMFGAQRTIAVPLSDLEAA